MTVSKDLRLRPVVAFDVDGVLRVHSFAPLYGGLEQPGSRPAQNLFSAEVTMEKAEYPSLFHGKPHWDEDGTHSGTEHFSVEGAELIRSVVEGSRADAVWATTWQRWANTYFAPHLGIPEIPVAVETLEPEERNWAHCSPAWKSAQLSRQFDGRPLIWLDDNMPDRPSEDLIELRRPIDRALTLCYKVDGYTGITPEDVVAINAWIELASTPEGQKELRAERVRMLAERRAEYAKSDRRWARESRLFSQVAAKVEELYPGQSYLGRELGSMAKFKDGLTAESVGYALKRHSVQADAEELAAKLRVRGYHRKFAQPDTDLEPPVDDDF